MFLTHLGKISFVADRPAEAQKLLGRALTLSYETGKNFDAPQVLSTLAWITKDATRQQQALEKAEAILSEGCVGHNYLRAYRDAIEVGLHLGDWDGVERYALALETYTTAEPLPWAEFIIARGRTLVSHGRGNRDGRTLTRLRELRNEADQIGFRVAIPALEQALAANG